MKRKEILTVLLVVFIVLTGCSKDIQNKPPSAIVIINGKKIETELGTYSWETKGLFSNHAVIADASSPSQIAENMKVIRVKQDSVARIKFSDDSSPQLKVFLWEENQQAKEIPLKGTQFKIPSQPGKYVMEISAKWSNGDASYTFVVEVQSNIQKIEVNRFDQLKIGTSVSFTEPIEMNTFIDGFKNAQKVPGITNMVNPMFKVTIGEESYFLWLTKGRGTIMNTRDTHTIYELSDQTSKAIQQLLIKTSMENGGLRLVSSTNFPLSPEDVMFYIGVAEPTPIEKVPNGVYVHGVHAHTGFQALQIFSKVNIGDFQITKVRLEGESLIIEISSHKAKTGEISHPYIIYGLSLVESPRNYVVNRNGKMEKKKEIAYGIE
jgi:hypothetical protein